MVKRDNKYFPFLNWLPSVNRSTLKADFIAGITGAVIVLPQGVAFALIAGLPPIYGLYTAMVTPIVAALFGSSYHLISGPTTAISIVVFSSVSDFAVPGTQQFIQLALTLTLIAGLFQFLLGLTRMGILINFVSHSVIIGFTSGAAILIASSQIKHFLGITVPTGSDFWHSWQFIMLNLGQTNTIALLIGLITLLSAILIKKFWPKAPNMLLAMVLGSLAFILLNAGQNFVAVIGSLPSHLPPFSMPTITREIIRDISPNAFAVALLGLIEAVAIARSVGSKSGQRINGNQEFIGQGLSNIVGSFFSSYAGSGSFSRSGINYQAGAKTPMAAIFAAIILMFVIMFIAPLAAYLPMSAMGGIILLVAYNLIDVKHIKKILKASKAETTVMTITFIATLTIDLEFAIYIGVIFSLVFYLQRTSKPRIVVVAPDPSDAIRKFSNVQNMDLTECPQLKIIRIEGSLFFGAVDHVTEKFEALRRGEEKHLLIVGPAINLIDVAGAEMLVDETERWKQKGGGIYICGLKQRARKFLTKGNYFDLEGSKNIYSDKKAAVKSIYEQLDRNICNHCQSRIFLECEGGKIGL